MGRDAWLGGVHQAIREEISYLETQFAPSIAALGTLQLSVAVVALGRRPDPWTRQDDGLHLMAAFSVALDHLVILVEDLDAVSGAFAREGFTVTPRTEHSAEMGTANRCVMLEGVYLELLAIIRPTERNSGWRELLASGGGVRGIALRSSDLADTARRLEAHHVPASPVLSFSRQADEATLRFSVIRVDRTATPGMQLLACQHHTPELLWRPEWCRHGNGTRALRHASIPAADPTGTATLLSLFPATAATECEVELTPTEGPATLGLISDSRRDIDLAGLCGLRLELRS